MYITKSFEIVLSLPLFRDRNYIKSAKLFAFSPKHIVHSFSGPAESLPPLAHRPWLYKQSDLGLCHYNLSVCRTNKSSAIRVLCEVNES